ncbi:helix-turn-helix transcriptional regulator [Streptacidiphilus sp. N1-10]|uniref:Helix-turn-helix transcriptional regulator n=1 Tax=Streptacidiphilus jeojiensis TaxID=3229225 RepID=A0ABV6XLC7_9ACTN
MPRSASSAAQAARERLGARLRDLRLDAALDVRGHAARCGWSPSKTSRIETGRTAPSDTDIRTWCMACDSGDLLADLLADNRQADQLYTEWRRHLRGGYRRLQDDLLPLHDRTRLQRVYTSSQMPGFLQTAGYARTLLTSIATFRDVPTIDIEEAVASRLRRRQALSTAGHRFVVLMEESVLHNRIGNRAVMQEQLAYLVEAMRLPSLALGVIPFASERSAMWQLETFYMFDLDRVIVENLSAEINVTTPSEIALYERAFLALGGLAVYGGAARALIDKALIGLS